MSAGGTEVVLAVDLGGTSMKGAVVSVEGAPLGRCDTETGADGPDNLARLLDLFETLRTRARAAGLRPVGAGVVTPGVVDRGRGIVTFASNLRWSDVALGDQVRRRLALPVEIDHDVRSAGLAEGLVGCAQGIDQFVHVPVGTGVAAALVSRGSAFSGSGGAAGELGHVPVHPAGDWCVCGQRGCLEAYASGAGIARRYAARSGGIRIDAAEVAARIARDPVAAQVWREAVEALALGLVTTTLMVDPTLIVIGGGVSRSGETLLGPLREAVTERLAWRAPPVIRASRLGASAGRIGAAMVAMSAAGRSAARWDEHVVRAWVDGTVVRG